MTSLAAIASKRPGKLILWLLRLARFAELAEKIGAQNALKLFCQRYYRGEFTVSIKGLPSRFWIRPNTADAGIFRSVIAADKYRARAELKAKLIIDGGANVGFSTAYFAARYPEAKVVAIEPESGNIEQLAKNTNALNNVEIVQAGLWSRAEKLAVESAGGTDGFTVTEIPGHSERTIDGVTIPQLMERAGVDTIDILKLDIEGAEGELFRDGCVSWLKNVRLMFIELHETKSPGCSALLAKALAQLDCCWFVRGENVVVEIRKSGERPLSHAQG
jgi:FkbM family methyltransferase